MRSLVHYGIIEPMRPLYHMHQSIHICRESNIMIIALHYGVIWVHYGVISVHYGVIWVHYGVILVHYGVILVHYGVI